jgi:hypothetical protein
MGMCAYAPYQYKVLLAATKTASSWYIVVEHFDSSTMLLETSMQLPTRRLPLFITFLIIISVLLLSACEARIARNADGSYTLETTVSEADMQTAITASLADPLIQELSVDLKSGYILTTGTRKRLNNSGQIDTLSFRLDLGVNAGQLTASISDALLDGLPIAQDRVALWNERIANRLSNSANRNPNSRLQSVGVSENLVTLTWKIEPK